MSDNLSEFISQNRPFPDGDIETIPPDLFQLEPGCTLASYMLFETALARIAGSNASGFGRLLARDPATHRYTVLSSTMDCGMCCVVAAVRRDAGARDQVQPVLGPRFSPALITSPVEIGPDRAFIFSLNAALTLAAGPRVQFAFHWLREIAAGEIQDQLGDDIDSGMEASVRAVLSGCFLGGIALDEQGWLRFLVTKRNQAGLDLSSTLNVESTIRTSLPPDLTPLVRTILDAGGGLPLAAGSDRSAVTTIDCYLLQQSMASAAEAQCRPANGSGVATALAASAYDKVLQALEKKYAAGLSWGYHKAANGAPLVDCSFDFTAGGLAAYGTALRGDFSSALAAPSPHTRLSKAALTEALEGHNRIELHLPFLDRRQWVSRWDALAKADIEASEEGRLFAYTVSASDRIRQNNEYQSTLALAGSLLFPKGTSSFDLRLHGPAHGRRGILGPDARSGAARLRLWARGGRVAGPGGAAGGFWTPR